MPTKSKRQWRFMALLASGKKKVKGLSKEKAKEYLDETEDYKKLPEKVKK